MTGLATYERHGDVAKITLNDGKVNVMSRAMIEAVNECLDHAENDGVGVILRAEGRFFSAGFDLKVFQNGTAEDIYTMRHSGAEMVLRIHEFPNPVVAACHATAYPMGAFPIIASDFRIGTKGDHKIGMNEVAIGLSLPRWAIELSRSRLNPAYLNRATVTGEMFSHEEGLKAGFFDQVVEAGELEDAALAAAERLAKLDLAAMNATKRNVRSRLIGLARKLIDEDITLEGCEARVAERDATASETTPLASSAEKAQ